MNEFLCRRFVEKLSKGDANDKPNRKIIQPGEMVVESQLPRQNNESKRHISWSTRFNESNAELRFDAKSQQYKTMKDVADVNYRVKFVNGKRSPYRSYSYQTNKDKFNYRKTRPFEYNPRLKSSGGKLILRRPYFRNKPTATNDSSSSEKSHVIENQADVERRITNGDYTISRPNVDNVSPVYSPNRMETVELTTEIRTPWYPTMATPNLTPGPIFNNYAIPNVMNSYAANPPAWTPSDSSPTYDNNVNGLEYQQYYSTADERPFLQTNTVDWDSDDSAADDLQNIRDEDFNVIGILNSDMYEIILTTIAFMAFGTYFITMMMRVTNMNPSQMLTIVGEGNGENPELGRKLKNLEADELQKLNELTERVIYFIEEYRDSMTKLRK